jgi:hypothetical protein
MADPNTAIPETQGKGSDEKLLETARKRMKLAIEALSDSREDELDDLRFRAASPDNQWQWPDQVLSARGAVQGSTINARPCLTINKLPQHVLQVTNDQRQNRPSIKVIPVDDKADPKVADILNGIIRHIEYISDADVAYDTACDNQVTYGEGYFRILTEYCDEMSFDQDIKIGRIRNSFSVYMDPTMQDPCGSDAQWCFITQDLTKEEFERQFPKADPVSNFATQGVGDEGMSAWVTAETIRVAEYFYYDNVEKTICQYADGSSAVKGTPEADMKLAMGIPPMIKDGKPVERKTSIKRVKWCKLNGFQVLESNDWAGKYIPVIRVIGNEFEIEGQLYVSGLVRNAKDAQRMYNYWASQEVEMLALAPKAPFIGYGGQFEGYEDQWKRANIDNVPYLEINPDAADHEGKPLPLPQRALPPMPQAGIIQAKMGAADDIKGTTGQYDASLGSEANEKSGKAIIARERQTDTGTFHYVDNLARAIRYCGRQIVDLIPKIYDTQRTARIIGVDGEAEHAQIDPNQSQPMVEQEGPSGEIQRIYNPSIGKYDVMVSTGPSYMTKRQEAAEAQAQLLQGNPDLWKVAGDLFVKNLDWPGSDELAKRLAKMVPPELMSDNDESPELAQAKQVIQALQQQLQHTEGMVQQVIQSVDAQKAENEDFKNDVAAFKALTERMKALEPAMTPEDITALVQQTVQSVLNTPLDEGDDRQEGQVPPQGGMPTPAPQMGGMLPGGM